MIPRGVSILSRFGVNHKLLFAGQECPFDEQMSEWYFTTILGRAGYQIGLWDSLQFTLDHFGQVNFNWCWKAVGQNHFVPIQVGLDF